MGSLSNLYISQSYTSLIHLGSDGPITTASVELQDGLGNGLGIFVNSLGDVNISGDISASNIPAEITSKGEFNAYTASTNVRLNNLETTSASVNVSVNALNVFTASQSSASVVASINNLNQFSASALTSISNLNASSASQQISIDSLNSATSSYANSASVAAVDAAQQQSINSLNAVTASFLTSSTDISALNAFTQSANIRLNNLESTSASVNISVSNLNTFSASAKVSIDALNTFTASQTSFNASATSSISQLLSFSSSLDANFVTEAELAAATGSLITQINTKLDTSSFNAYTASQSTASIVTSISNLNSFTQSANVRLTNLETTSASVNTSITNINAFTSSQQSFNASATASIVELLNLSSSLSGGFVTEGELSAATASLIAQINTKLNTSSFNSYTSSNDQRVSSLEANSASVNVSITNINSTTASLNTSVANINLATASLQSQLATIGTQSGSWITESETASFARTNANNTFTGIQTFDNVIVNGTASVALLNVLIESSSVIYSSGSNQFGDAANDVQTLYGSTNIVNELTASGLHYPTADGIFTGQVLQTNAAGTLSFGNVNAVFENVRNGELTTITVGTPLYVSGAQGDTPIVYRADATNPNKMPVTFVAMESIASNATGRGITLGLITGINMTGYPVGTQLWVDGIGQLTNVRPTGSADIVQPIGIVTKTGNGGQLNILNPGPVLLPNIQTGYIWVGNGNNQPISVATSSLQTDTSGLVTTASFNAYTSSTNQRLTAIETVSGSWITESETGSFAILGANQIFTGNNTFIGNTVVSQSAAFGTASFYGPVEITKGIRTNVQITGSLIANKVSVYDFDTLFYGSQMGGTTAQGTFFGYGSTDYTFTLGAYTGLFDNELQIYANNGGIEFRDFNGASYPSWLKLLPNSGTNPKPIFTRGLEVTGSTNIAELTASLQNGYVWVGNAAGKTTTVSTSSFGGGGADLTQLNQATASLQAFTASAEIRLTNLESTTSSLNTSITNINSFTSSANQRLTAIETVSGSWITEAETGSFATTGSNGFFGNQNINGNIAVSGSITLETSGSDGFAFSGKALFLTNSVQTGITIESPIHFYQVGKGNFYIQNNVAGVGSGSMNMIAANGANLNISASTVIMDSDLYLDDESGTTKFWINKNFDAEFQGIKTEWNEVANTLNVVAAEETVELIYNGWGTGYDNGYVVNVGTNGTQFQDWNTSYVNQTWLKIPVNNNNNPAPIFTRGLEVTGSTNIAELTASLQNGYVWVGNASGKTTTVSTSSFGGGADLGPLNQATASLQQATASLQAFTSSANQRLTAIETVSGSWITEAETGSFAKLDANQIFTGNNTITGNTVVSQSATFGTASFYAPMVISNGIASNVQITGSLIANKVSVFNFDSLFYGSQLGGTIQNGTYFGYGTNDYTHTIGAYSGSFDNELQTYIDSTGIYFKDFNGSGYNTFLKLLPNSGGNPKPIMTRGLEVTGSTNIAELTASLQQGYVWVGDVNGRTTTVATSSFGGGGSGAGFPFTGSAQITGSLGVTGSLSGFVNALTISANTASMDFNNGNFFTLQLVSGSITHLTATNIKPGQTINLLVKTDSGSAAASGSLTFSSAFKFAGGFDYTPTAITASQDLVSFVTFDTTQILAAQVKNLS